MTKQKLIEFVRKNWKEWRITILLVLFVIIPLKSSLADWNWVPTGSMNPTILEGDFLLVNKAAYDLRLPLTFLRLARWADPERGDIIICYSPDDGTRLVKRVIGVPGDTIEMKNNCLIINSEPVGYERIDPPYSEQLPDGVKDRCVLATEDLDGVEHTVMAIPSVYAKRSFGPIRMPQGRYFVMGDNRDGSRDSRFFGFVDRERIVGRAMRVILSFDITDRYQPRFGRFFTSLK